MGFLFLCAFSYLLPSLSPPSSVSNPSFPFQLSLVCRPLSASVLRVEESEMQCWAKAA
jgi:hypothetical protein